MNRDEQAQTLLFVAAVIAGVMRLTLGMLQLFDAPITTTENEAPQRITQFLGHFVMFTLVGTATLSHLWKRSHPEMKLWWNFSIQTIGALVSLEIIVFVMFFLSEKM